MHGVGMHSLIKATRYFGPSFSNSLHRDVRFREAEQGERIPTP
jgi:hypothetical protein